MTITDERMDELANWQKDAMDSGDILEIVTDALKEYWKTYPEDFEFQWDEYQTVTGEELYNDNN